MKTKKILTLLLTLCTSNSLISMKLDAVDPDVILLLKHNAAHLKALLKREIQGNFVLELTKAEEKLSLWCNTNVEKPYSKETMHLARLVAERPAARDTAKRSIQYVSPQSIWELTTIIRDNPYIINAYDPNGDTLLHYAAACNSHVYGNYSIVEELLYLGANPTLQDADKKTPLHRARTVETAKLLLKANATINAIDRYGNTPLHWHCCHDDMVQFLLKNGADISIKNNAGCTPIDLATVDGYKKDVCKKGFTELGIFASAHLPKNESIIALLRNNAKRFKKLINAPKSHKTYNIIANFFSVIKKSDFSWTMDSSKRGMASNQKGCLFKQCTFDDLYRWFGKSTIICVHNDLEKRIAITDHYIKVDDERNLYKFLIKHYYLLNYYDDKYKDLFTRAMRLSAYLCLDMLIKKGGCPSRRPLLLHCAVQANKPDLFAWLYTNYRYGANILKRDEYGRNALEYAISLGGREECENKLRELCKKQFFKQQQTKEPVDIITLKKYLESGLSPNDTTSEHYTVLHSLVPGSLCLPTAYKMVLFLVENNADVNAVARPSSIFAQSVLDIIITYCDYYIFADLYKIVELLVNKGAIVTEKTLKSDDINYELKTLLQKAYENQQCCICFEHPADLGSIACPNKHINNFICKSCLNNTIASDEQGNKACPLCRETMAAVAI